MNPILTFVFSHLYMIALIIWSLLLVFVSVRFYLSNFESTNINFWTKLGYLIKDISYFRILLVAIIIHILYGLFLTWGQYYVWMNSSEITKALASLPLPDQVQFPYLLEWIRPLFDQSHGYFMFYVWGRFWMNILLLFVTSLILYSLFKVWRNYRGGFTDEGPILILILMLISGWPGLFISIILGFVFAVLLFGFNYLKTVPKVRTIFRMDLQMNTPMKLIVVEPAFILSTLIALFFANYIINIVI